MAGLNISRVVFSMSIVRLSGEYEPLVRSRFVIWSKTQLFDEIFPYLKLTFPVNAKIATGYFTDHVKKSQSMIFLNWLNKFVSVFTNNQYEKRCFKGKKVR